MAQAYTLKSIVAEVMAESAAKTTQVELDDLDLEPLTRYAIQFTNSIDSETFRKKWAIAANAVERELRKSGKYKET